MEGELRDDPSSTRAQLRNANSEAADALRIGRGPPLLSHFSQIAAPQGCQPQGQVDTTKLASGLSDSAWSPAFAFPALGATGFSGRQLGASPVRMSAKAGLSAPGQQRGKRQRDDIALGQQVQELRMQQGTDLQTGMQSKPPLSVGMTVSVPCEPPSSLKQDSSHASFSRVTSMASLLPSGALTQQKEPLDKEHDDYLMKLLWKGRSMANPAPLLSAAETKSAGVGNGPRGSTAAVSWPQGKLPAATRTTTAPLQQPKADTNIRQVSVRATLGERRYSEARAATLKHQEIFLGQLFELHRVMQLQRHLVAVCDQPEAMYEELAKLEAEQKLRIDTEENAELAKQEHGKEARLQQPESAAGPACNASADLADSQQQPIPCLSGRCAALPPSLTGCHGTECPQPGAGQQPSHARPPFMQPQFPQAGPWAGAYGTWGAFPYGQAQMPMGGYPPWGAAGLGMNPMASMGGAAVGGNPLACLGGSPFGGFSHPYASPYGVMDPLTAWYAMHYGQQCAHAAALTQATAARAADQQQRQPGIPFAAQEPAARLLHSQSQLAAAGAALSQKPGDAGNNTASVRWWQDPEKVFGIAADPEVVAMHSQPMLRMKPPYKHISTSATEATSKPTRQPSGVQEGSRSPQEEDRPARASTKRRALASGGTGNAELVSQGAPSHRAGSGVSAFKKLSSKAGTVRPPPTQAESIGSEISRSAVECSAMDEGESSGVAHGAQQAPGGHEAAGGKHPGVAKSAADILVSLSGA